MAQATEERLERMGILEKRLHLLEKECGEEPTTCCEMVSLAIWDFGRSVPWCSICAIGPSLLGAYMMIKYGSHVSEGVTQLDLGEQIEELTADILLVCVIVVILDVMVLLSAFPATGATREYVFGHSHTGWMACVACMAGPCVLSLLMAMLVLLFLVLFAGVTVTVPATTLLSLAAGACEAKTYGKLSAAFADMIGSSPLRTKTALENICKSDYKTMTDGNFYFAAGVAFCMLGQVWQLVTHMSNWEKVMSQKELDNKAEEAQIRDYLMSHELKDEDA